MVKFWIKQLEIINKNSKIDFDKIIFDILSWNFWEYDIRPLNGFINLFRVRIWTYRLIYKNIDWNIKILFLWKRWDVYKWLRKL